MKNRQETFNQVGDTTTYKFSSDSGAVVVTYINGILVKYDPTQPYLTEVIWGQTENGKLPLSVKIQEMGIKLPLALVGIGLAQFHITDKESSS